ncbi:pentatricopeptide repeat-containing protein-like protein [Amylocarpus encephaloides]|uniref:Pentatricopeptide repeat-containing protein-like protein n=1 Tax=Amylocarpus encephaloides TaxID=45428 RepID=A0A9P7YR28_9HELO|nr:pentatricopeptide repeat-containing protein-like protein [Amylocarpus encephaloides]
MSTFCSSPSSTSSLVSKVAHRQVLSFLYPLESVQATRLRKHEKRARIPSAMVNSSNPTLESWFIKSLASASSCHKHSPKVLTKNTFFSSQRPEISDNRRRLQHIAYLRQQFTNALDYRDVGYIEKEPNRTKEELLDLVDDYDGGSLTDSLPLVDGPTLYQPSDGPNLTISDKVEDEWPPPNYTWPADAETKIILASLRKLMRSEVVDPEELYQKYREIPKPRATYLDPTTRHQFLRFLYTIERKDERSMLRYLSVVDDLKNSAIPLTSMEWNSAISFVARYVGRSTEAEVEAALHMWREMEQVAGVKATSTTFNILFDVSCKAGKFSLAEMIYQEMETRGLPYDRYHHVSLIHYYGLQRNGDGARAAYKALVEAGEIIDTIVLNAMMSALVTSCEANAAENIYERMKAMYSEQEVPRVSPRHYLQKRAITRTLKRIAIQAKGNPEHLSRHQKKTIIAPDIHTYRILINYFAIQAGELSKTAKLLDEMKHYHIPVHGALFLTLFKGFAIHGGIRYTEWTDKRLEKVWKSYMTALKSNSSDLHISRWMAMWVVKAFAKCSGKDRTMEVWDQIKEKWEPDDLETAFVMEQLATIIDAAEARDRRRDDWLLGV